MGRAANTLYRLHCAVLYCAYTYRSRVHYRAFGQRLAGVHQSHAHHVHPQHPRPVVLVRCQQDHQQQVADAQELEHDHGLDAAHTSTEQLRRVGGSRGEQGGRQGQGGELHGRQAKHVHEEEGEEADSHAAC